MATMYISFLKVSVVFKFHSTHAKASFKNSDMRIGCICALQVSALRRGSTELKTVGCWGVTPLNIDPDIGGVSNISARSPPGSIKVPNDLSDTHGINYALGFPLLLDNFISKAPYNTSNTLHKDAQDIHSSVRSISTRLRAAGKTVFKKID